MLNKALFLVLFAVSFSVLLGSNQEAYAITYTFSDQASCESAPFFGTWDGVPNPKKCTITLDTTINAGDTWSVTGNMFLINSGTLVNNGLISLPNSQSAFSNIGTITNNGQIKSCIGGVINDGTMDNNGLIFLPDAVGCSFVPANGRFTNAGMLNNDGTIRNDGGTLVNTDIINNYGTITNSLNHDFTNGGTINNFFGGLIRNFGLLSTLGGTILNVGGLYAGVGLQGSISGPLCDSGTILQGNACVPSGLSLICGPNTFESDGMCLPVSALAFCGDKTIDVAGFCVPNIVEICAEGTTPNFDTFMCFAESISSMIGGELLEINTVSLLVGAIGTNPVITGLVGITIAGVAGQTVWFVHRKRKSE